ncbi:hypothetical protein Tco_0430337, partial [Tanacetum coccineum]
LPGYCEGYQAIVKAIGLLQRLPGYYKDTRLLRRLPGCCEGCQATTQAAMKVASVAKAARLLRRLPSCR